MQTGTHKTLNNKTKLYAMLNLRLNGLSLKSLAALYGVDWTSIRHQTRHFNLPKPTQTINLIGIISEVIPNTPAPTYKLVNGERINLGRNYRDYIIPIAKKA